MGNLNCKHIAKKNVCELHGILEDAILAIENTNMCWREWEGSPFVGSLSWTYSAACWPVFYIPISPRFPSCLRDRRNGSVVGKATKDLRPNRPSSKVLHFNRLLTSNHLTCICLFGPWQMGGEWSGMGALGPGVASISPRDLHPIAFSSWPIFQPVRSRHLETFNEPENSYTVLQKILPLDFIFRLIVSSSWLRCSRSPVLMNCGNFVGIPHGACCWFWFDFLTRISIILSPGSAGGSKTI